jgi:hypothetical protein
VRLSGESPYRGRVEVCRGDIWGSVCFINSRTFSEYDVAVVCRMLGYQPDYTLGKISNLHNTLQCLNMNVNCIVITNQLTLFIAAGTRVFSTTTTAQNPPLFADFNCGASANNLSDCTNPSGLTSNVHPCTSGVVGVQCTCKYSAQCHKF